MIKGQTKHLYYYTILNYTIIVISLYFLVILSILVVMYN